MALIVNVCPAATTKAPPDSVWDVIAATERLGEWTGASVVSVDPPGPAQPGQIVTLVAPAFGMKFTVQIDVRDLDPQHRWIDLVAHLPFGIDNHEHLTLAPTADGGTLVRFN
ncbi:MAG TPA: SRPBCC family protein [Candidatus Dormibacteraeota bacterium]|nr:SRPBCC family protein [Candidatus Dormibacteraeota bacterium]